MHRLVHTAMQNWLKLKNEWRSWHQKSLRQISNTFPWPQHKNRAVWMIYLPHAQCIIATFNKGLSRTKETKELLWTSLHNLGECSQINGQYTEAEAMNRQTLQLKETVLEKEHPDTLVSMNNLAICSGEIRRSLTLVRMRMSKQPEGVKVRKTSECWHSSLWWSFQAIPWHV
jgi:hypothetical protein